VPDQHDGAVDGVDDVSDVRRITSEAAERVGGGDRGDALGVEALDDAVPAGGLGERAVDEHDGGQLMGHGGLPFVRSGCHPLRPDPVGGCDTGTRRPLTPTDDCCE
jgi:hypothetical protein